MMGEANTYFEGIQVPSSIFFNVKMRASRPEENMQTDASAFEAWAIILHAKCKVPVEMEFDIPESCKPFSSINASGDVKKQHFMRFLYRAWKFTNQMEWFSIYDETCRSLVDTFEEEFVKTKTVNNVPDCESEVSKERGPESEHIIENVFAKVPETIKRIEPLTDFQDLTLPGVLYNQLPNGLFEDVVLEKNRIFPTGFFDLWGINEENELCIFELKNKDNLGAGILSELYFYVNYANDVFLTERFNKSTGKKVFRGYDKLKEAVEKGIKRIHACFLAPEFHSEIMRRRNAIQEILNKGESKIIFHFLKFDQEAISGFSNCLPGSPVDSAEGKVD